MYGPQVSQQYIIPCKSFITVRTVYTIPLMARIMRCYMAIQMAWATECEITVAALVSLV
jgi:hypothetical protein